MTVEELPTEYLERLHDGAMPLEPCDRTAYYNTILELLNASPGPLTHRMIADTVQRAQKQFNRAVSCAGCTG
jgi:hypothetical protein